MSIETSHKNRRIVVSNEYLEHATISKSSYSKGYYTRKAEGTSDTISLNKAATNAKKRD